MSAKFVSTPPNTPPGCHGGCEAPPPTATGDYTFYTTGLQFNCLRIKNKIISTRFTPTHYGLVASETHYDMLN